MKYNIVILMLLVTLNSFGQDTVKRNVPAKPVFIRIGHPANENNGALFILDGTIIEEKEFQNIKSETIESINILRNDSTIYSCNGRKNVVIIKTKKFSKRELRKLKKKDS